MSDWGFKTFYSDGDAGFDINDPIITQETLLYIPAGSSGSIDLAPYLNSEAAVRFMYASYHNFTETRLPYAVRSGSQLNYTAHAGVYAIVSGVVR